MKRAMPGDSRYIADLSKASELKLYRGTKKRAEPKGSVPKAWVEELRDRIIGILDDTEYSNSQKIAMMRIEVNLLQQAIQ